MIIHVAFQFRSCKDGRPTTFAPDGSCLHKLLCSHQHSGIKLSKLYCAKNAWRIYCSQSSMPSAVTGSVPVSAILQNEQQDLLPEQELHVPEDSAGRFLKVFLRDVWLGLPDSHLQERLELFSSADLVRTKSVMDEKNAMPVPIKSLEKRVKREWTGPRKPRRLPPQPPWTEEYCRQKESLIVQSILAADLDQISISEVLNGWLGKVTRPELGNVIKKLGSQKDYSLVLDVFRWMQQQKGRLKPKGHICSLMIGLLGRAGRVAVAKEVFQSMVDMGADLLHAYNALTAVYIRNGNLKAAMRLFDQLSALGLEADEISYNTLLRGLVCAGMSIEEGQMLYIRMRQQNIWPSIRTFNTLLDGICKSGQVDKLLAVLEEMELMDIEPDVCTFNTILGMFARNRKYKESVGIFSNMKVLAIKPNSVTYTIIIQMLNQRHMYEEAIATYQDMLQSECQPDLLAENLLVEVYAGNGLVDEATGIMRKLKEAGHNVNAMAWSALILACRKQGRLNEASLFVNEMELQCCQSDLHLCNKQLAALKKSGLVVEAQNLSRKMESQPFMFNTGSKTSKSLVSRNRRCFSIDCMYWKRHFIQTNGIGSNNII